MVTRTEPGGKSPVETVLGALPDHRQSGKGWVARCPAHEDDRASLSVGVGKDGKVVLHCHAGCDFKAVVQSLGLEEKDLFVASNGDSAGGRRMAAFYDYHAEDGRRLFQVVRFEPKDFRQRVPVVVNPRDDRDGDWAWGLKGNKPVLYRLPELLQAPPGQPVFVCEGEKDVDRLRKVGLVATTNPMGAGKWRDPYSPFLRGRHVVILPDNDRPGRDHAEQVAKSLAGVAASVKVLELPGLPDKGDVSDWLRAGGTKEELLRLAAECPEWRPGAPEGEPENGPEPWEPPVPLGAEHAVPPFPTDVLPPTLARWVEAEAVATQTPPDLAGMLALAVCAAGVAGKVRVKVRPGWAEPLNLFVVTALEVGERKSVVFRDALAPVKDYEKKLREDEAPKIAEKAADHRVLEKMLKATEDKAAREEDAAERNRLKDEARRLARGLAAHQVPAEPECWCDDETPESLAKKLAEQGGRMLQASDEGTAFEIVKGRYSEQGKANFEVYLKGHSGDSLRVGRVGRDGLTVDRPALSCALAVQPDVIRGLADHASMKGRGFLARWLYSLPVSRVGWRDIRPKPVPTVTADGYSSTVKALWETAGAVDPGGKPAAKWLEFSPAADRAIEDFERWLEPQLRAGGELSHLGGWANKLAGAVARVAAVLHMAEHAGTWNGTVEHATVEKAVRLGRDYLLPHALAAFDLMGADEELEAARAVVDWLRLNCGDCGNCGKGMSSLSKRDIYQGMKPRFKKVEELEPVLKVLEDNGYIRLMPQEKRPGAGRKPSPHYSVNPLAFQPRTDTAPRSHNSHNPHNSGREPGQQGKSAPRPTRRRGTL
jgi:hypothetical protein